jgi:hypothetical protein
MNENLQKMHFLFILCIQQGHLSALIFAEMQEKTGFFAKDA